MIPIDIPKKNSGRSGGGSGSDDEGLWDFVTQDVKPLRHKNTIAPAAPTRKAASLKAPPRPDAGRRIDKGAGSVAEVPGHREVDRRTAQKLKKGRYPVDVTVDLHGLTQEAAHKRMRTVLLNAHARQQRCVLVITGKGKSGKGKSGEGAGVIKRRVPDWLNEPALRAIVLRTETAKPEHGGSGALYVLLRRQRTQGDE